MRLVKISMLAAAVSSLALFAGDDGLRGPVSGLLVDPDTRAIRPIVGTPGASYAGEATYRDADFALAATDGRTALVSREGSLYVLRRLDSGLPVWRQIQESTTPIGRAAWSDDTHALAIHRPAEARVEMWSAMAETPEQTGSVDISSVSGRLSALAVSSDGTTAFAAFETEDSGTLYLMKAGEAPRMLLPLNRAGELILSGDQLYAVDRGRNEIFQIEDWDGNLSIRIVASEALGVSDPVGVALANNAKTLLVANGEGRQLIAIDIAKLAVTKVIDLEFHPTRLDASGSVYLLGNGVAGQTPAHVLDPGRMEVFFVPVSTNTAIDSIE